MRRRSPRTLAWWVATLSMAVLTLIAAALATVYLSAPLSAAVVAGDSMEPGIHRGDLVLTRQTAEYREGEVVAYQHPDLGLLLHRIVGRRDDGRLILQGDNNPRPDSYEPLPSEVTGRLFVAVPAAGDYVRRLQDPKVLAAFAATAAILVSLPVLGNEERRGRGRIRRGLSGAAFSQSELNLVGLFGILAVGSAVTLGALVFVGSTWLAPVNDGYGHVGTLAYRADGGDGVFDEAYAQSGDPLFRALTERVDVRFDYEFESASAAEVAGEYELYAQITHPNGWTRTLQLIGTTDFQGPELSVTTLLDLARVQALITRMEGQTGVESRVYQLHLVGRVDAGGMMAGQSFRDELLSELLFRMDPKQLQLLPGDKSDPFVTATGGQVTNLRLEEREIGALFVSLRVVHAQIAAAVAFGLSLLALAALAVRALLARRRDEGGRIRARYGRVLVPARFHELPRGAVLAEVSAFKDLVRLAEAEGLPILDDEGEVGHRFLLVHRDATYYYSVRTEESGGHRAATMGAA